MYLIKNRSFAIFFEERHLLYGLSNAEIFLKFVLKHALNIFAVTPLTIVVARKVDARQTSDRKI